MTAWRWTALLLTALVLALAAACGGGGGSGSTTGPTASSTPPAGGEGGGAGGGSGGAGSGTGLSLNAVSFRTVTVAVTPDGAGSVSDDLAAKGSALQACTACTERYRIGTRITLTARAGAGHVFEGWQGDECDGLASPSCVFTVERAVRLTAVFR